MTLTLDSRQVTWWTVHEFVEAALSRADVSSWPMAGTPAWCALAEGDPRKWAALFDAGEHWALRVETCQEHFGDAAKMVAQSEDWSVVARRIQDRNSFYAEKPWLKRVPR
ncbi:DUF2742 domain-containing protein [Mycobacterium montefiorense]|uniref:DUF2742 domain-containing protein n=1 Tax=Mycobacterium montefiorense TaxID=154654 RepID=UPI0021DE972A|nr:DUF2742 domain-containing protein [Mycobacterium montefiorense]MCV7428057.1 DUF2742 domain-containing protein [Mycobacterium montefiorense]GLE52324.1 hypothetical protein ATCCBAA256_18930 [Mycobacterium montefiorense]